MGLDINDTEAVRERLWQEIGGDNGTVMLGAHTHPLQHFQPMTAFCEPDTGQVWFYTRADTALARSIEEGKAAMMVVQRTRFQACVAGELTLQHDTGRIERYWNPIVAAWHPEGRGDPHLTMLCLDTRDAEVWLDEAGPVKFAWEIARANATGELPEVGGRRRLDLH